MEKLDQLFHHTINHKYLYEAAVVMKDAQGKIDYQKTYNRSLDTPMLMASVTKLLTTACVFQLIDSGQLTLDDLVATYLPSELIEGLHVIKGKSYGSQLTVRHLLSHTSGLPDYYLSKEGGVFDKVKKSDFGYEFDDEVAWIKKLTPQFSPGSISKAYYSDINFDLLGKIIEVVDEKPLNDAFDMRVIKPLNLTQTFLATKETMALPSIYFKNDKIERPLFIQSSYASGGCVTTAQELMIFIQAYYSGRLFKQNVLESEKNTNRLQMSFYPIKYGLGQMYIKIGYPLGRKYTLLGHSGSTGSFAFYCPEKELFLVGDFPQIKTPATCVRFAIKAALLA